jgi:hypothetical protein
VPSPTAASVAALGLRQSENLGPSGFGTLMECRFGDVDRPFRGGQTVAGAANLAAVTISIFGADILSNPA